MTNKTQTPTRGEVLNAVREILDRLDFNFENLTEHTYLMPTMDTLDIVELTMEIEKELDAQITDSTVENWHQIKDVIDTYLTIKTNG